VREDAFDVYLRTRGNLLKAVVDGIDYHNAVADHYFSVLNVSRQGDDFVKSWEDHLTISILKEEIPSEQRQFKPLSRRHQKKGKQKRSDAELSEVQLLNEHLTRVSEMMHDGEHHWFDRVIERPLEQIFTEDIDVVGEAGYDHYHNIHPFSPVVHPHKRVNTITGEPRWIETLRRFYLPSEPGAQSNSEIHAEIEKAQDKHDISQENPFVSGTVEGTSEKKIQQRINEIYENTDDLAKETLFYDIEEMPDSTDEEKKAKKKEFEKMKRAFFGQQAIEELAQEKTNESRQPFAGRHHDISPHSIYMTDFERWKAENPNAATKVSEMFPEDDAKQDFELRKQHFESRAKDWFSDEIHPEPYIGETDEERIEREMAFMRGEDVPRDAPEPIHFPKKMSYNGFRHGLEFMTPAQRYMVAKHLYEKDTKHPDNQMISLGDGTYTSAGRIARDLKQRVNSEYEWFHRGQNTHGGNVNAHYESETDVPKATEALDGAAFYEALKKTNHPTGGTMHDFILGELNRKLHKPLSEKMQETYADEFDEDEDEYEPLTLDELKYIPRINNKTAANARQRAEDEDISYKEAYYKELEESQMGGENEINEKQLLELVGLDKNLNPFEAKKDHHPDTPLMSAEDFNNVRQRALSLADRSRDHKRVRNSAQRHLRGHDGYRATDVPENERGLYVTDDGKTLKGLASFFSDPFHESGGFGRSPSAFLHFLHGHHPKDEDGFSHIGNEDFDDAFFTANENHTGLTGFLSPMFHDKRAPLDVDPAGVLSAKDASRPHGFRDGKASAKGRTRKNTFSNGVTSFAAPYTNIIRTMSKGKIKEKFGGKANEYRNVISGPLGDSLHTYQSSTDPFGHSKRRSRHAHRHATKLGRMRPPHDPQEKGILSVNMLNTGRHPFSHKVRDAKEWKGSMGRLKGGGGDLEDFLYVPGTEESDSSTGRLQGIISRDLSGDFDYETKIGDIESLMLLQEEDERKLEEMKEQGEVNPKLIEIMDERHEEIQSIEQSLREYEHSEQYGDVYTNKQRLREFKHIDNKDAADNAAHIEMAKRLLATVPSDKMPDPEQNPTGFWSISARALADAGRVLRMADPQDGIFTYSYGGKEVEQKSASEIFSSEGDMIDPHARVGNIVKRFGVEVLPESNPITVLQNLGLPNDEYHNDMIERLFDHARTIGPVRVMTNSAVHSTGVPLTPRGSMAFHDASIENHQDAFTDFVKQQRGKDKQRANELKDRYERPLSFIPSIMRRDQKASEINNLTHIPLTPVEMSQRQESVYGNAKRGNAKNPNIKATKNRIRSALHDLIVSHGEEEEGQIYPSKTVTKAGWGTFPVGPATTGQHHTVQDMWGSTSAMDFGYPGRSPVGWEIENGQPVIGFNTQDELLHSVPHGIMAELHGEEKAALWGQQQWQPLSTVNYISRANMMGQQPNDDIILRSEDLMTLMNPDLLYKEDEARPPPLLPMHRLFSVKNLDSFRGFTGDWVVSAYPEGQRIIITRDGDDISAYDSNADDVAIRGRTKKHLKKLTEKDFVVDAIKRPNHIYIFDILDYDGTNVSDLSTPERLKLLRGQFDSYENAHIPSPDDTVVTDEGGLEAAVERLSEENPRLLLRDGKSTYMKGERRHPKWFMLRRNKDIALIILDVRGKGPFTYRLGAGPVDEDDLGNRGVKFDGETYLDVGTVKSPKPFEEGDIVRVSVSGVKEKKRSGRLIYDVTPNTIRAGSSIESPASLESLSLLAKSHPIIPVHYDIEMADEKMTLSFDGIDDVVYKMTMTRNGYWVHEPQALLSPLMKSDYAIQLAESIRPIWHDVAGVMISKKLERVRSMTDPKDREASEEESAGIIDSDDDETILKPEEQKKMADMLSRIADLTERISKEKMTGRTSAQGVGLFGDGVESPRGPTEVQGEQTQPDWDMLERPTEDPEEEYPAARKKRKILEQSNETEIEEPQG
tara:strand:+ start:1637 stop:7447 length:5811 start_codon:yes stop_codon:yes gene_type:complete